MRKILLTLLVPLLFLTIVLFIVSISAYSLIYPGIYIDGLREAGAFAIVEEGLSKVPGASFILIPENGVEGVVTPLLTNFLGYLRGDYDQLSLQVDIDLPKLRTFFLDSIKEVKLCRPGQYYSFDELDSLCRPAEVSVDLFLDELLKSKEMNFFSSNSTDLTKIYGIEQGSKGRENLDNIRGYIQYYKTGVLFIGILFIILIFGIYFVNSRDARKTTRLVGIPTLLAGLLILISIWFGASVLENLVSEDIEVKIGKEIISYLVASAMRPFYVYSISFFVVGICFVILSFFLPKVKEKKL